MPIYEYECPRCHCTFERLVSIRNRSWHPCPECPFIGKLIPSAPAVQFKGSGFYHNDYGPGSKRPSGDRE